MPQRDPSTGKFVSSGGGNTAVYSGGIGVAIPAADLAGGTATVNMDGETAEVIDFTEFLDHDEVFEAKLIQGRITLSLPTTATAEGSAVCGWALRSDFNTPGATDLISSFYTGSAQREQGKADVRSQATDSADILQAGYLAAGPSLADTTNGLAAGGDRDRDRFEIAFEHGPTFDQDDELTLPQQFGIDNVSDHAVETQAYVQMFGEVHGDC